MKKNYRCCALTLALGLAAHAHAQSYSKTETIEYHDDTGSWVLGQVARTATDGIETSRTTFNGQALPEQMYQFGKRQSVLAYHADGNLASIRDGNDNVTALGDYARGIPRTIVYADGTRKSATVNEAGFITSVTDQVGATTCYDYDPMGRLLRTTYPSESQTGLCAATTWDVSYTPFRPIRSGEYAPPGIAAGQWKHEVIRGAYRKYTYYDALWRPVLTHEFDERDSASTLSATLVEYDMAGRVRFQSYPSSDVIPASRGIWTTYDALGRVLTSTQDSEIGPLKTLTEYLPGLRIRTTNPRGVQTLVDYQAFDAPDTSMPVAVTALGGLAGADIAVTEIQRDVFGKPRRITRRDADNSVRADRHYVYYGTQELCKSIEPETGATVHGYDGAGNVVWTTTGLDLPDPNSCDLAPNRPAIARTYDARNRVKTITFPDGHGNQEWRYHGDGLPWSVTTWNGAGYTDAVISTYVYNNRRLLTGESTGQVGWGAPESIGYAYDSHANLFTLRYPTSRAVTFFPNALGQPTLVRDEDGQVYASGIEYHPNGALRKFIYGNNVVHSMTQTDRQMPARITESLGLMDQDIRYDANGNVIDIYDHANGSQLDRHMAYDGMDRLIGVVSPSFGGDGIHRYRYDSLDNLRSWTLAGVKDYAEYLYTNNRLTSIRNSSAATVMGLDYDVRGNITNRNGQHYYFDWGNRLREATGKEYYRYDAHNRRIMAWSPTAGGIFSVYSQAGQLLYEDNERSNTRSEHIHLQGRILVTRTRPRTGGTAKTTYHHTDALGSTIAISDAGSVLRRNTYEPYGAVIGQPNYEGIGYTGHVQDAATGLTYMQQRYYDPQIGRFLSVDPVTAYEEPGRNFNRYWYANNNPYKFVDPDGRQSLGHRDDVPWWDITGRIGNWFNKTRDLSVFYAYDRSDRNFDALFQQYKDAGDAIFTSQTLFLPGLGAAGIEAASVRSFTAGSGTRALKFFEGAKYSARLFRQKDRYHAFPQVIDRFAAKFGEVKYVPDSRGVKVEMLTMKGEWKTNEGTVKGTFEYIKNQNNEIYHRFFRPDRSR